MSEVASDSAGTPVAGRAGADLRAARERLGWSLPAIAEHVRIRKVHLEALEDGRLSDLPSHAYALAFLRSYARALGLDPDETVRRFKNESGEAEARPDLIFPAPVPERGLPSGAIVLLAFVLCICAYAGWYRLSAEGRLPAETVISVPERLAPLAEQAIPPAAPSSSANASGTPMAAASSGAVSASAGAATARGGATSDTSPPAPAISPTSAAAASIQGRPQETMPPQALAPVPAPAADESRIVLRASAPTWLFVKDKAGVVLLNRTLKPGETWPVPARGDLLLTTGNAAGTDILVDGAETASIGGQGVVRRDLPLDIDQIRDGKLAMTVTSQLTPPKPRP